MRFVQGQFIEKYDPTIEDSYQKTIEVTIAGEKGQPETTQRCHMEILDTAGTDQFAAMRELYLKSGDVFVLVYSVISAVSFHDLTAIHEQVLRSDPSKAGRILLVGNKADLSIDRVISKSQGEELAQKWGVPFFETSALTGANVDSAFTLLPSRLVKETVKNSEPIKQKSSCNII